MRLLPERNDHGRRRAGSEDPEAVRYRYRRRDDEHLPLRHLSAGACGNPRRHSDDEVLKLGRSVMLIENVSRRSFLTAASGLAIGFFLPLARGGTAAEAPAGAAPVPEINAWVVIRPDDT